MHACDPGRSGFKTQREAQQALRRAIAAHEQGRTVRSDTITVEQFLLEWHAAIQVSVRPTTWRNYRNYMSLYVIPHIGSTRLQDLTPVRLNLLYASSSSAAVAAEPAGWRRRRS